MRTTNKLKVIIICILMYMSLLMTLNSFAQGPPNGWPTGGGNGGPPPPPDNYCLQNPQDPACNGTSVPVGSTEGMIIFAFLAGTFFIYKLNGNSFNFKKS